jgi:hypothetical protein
VTAGIYRLERCVFTNYICPQAEMLVEDPVGEVIAVENQ